ncbi:pre-mRNA-splicing factor prp46 [Serendipita sp. 396]|nr:pre-mRNA-splicing factor prp46 [Serendipita sp. 396]KAG8801398.1 pre-mRNA-splicing factor prp46 [Serendipita sp. 398]KAG8830411.1 pre-mRNA-splicing factor prp46 [Serendipita sp. 400]KAG8848980.1 pre-mRNA-splicing factor prp46 [Serendipita sp. 411]
MADVHEFSPLPELKRLSAKRTYAMFASETLDNFPENEQVTKMRTNIRIRNEYKDYTSLPAVLLSQQTPVGPVRPKTLAITAGPSQVNTSGNDRALTLASSLNGSNLNGISATNDLAVGSLATSTNFTKALALHKQVKTVKPAYHPQWKLIRVISGHLGWVRSIAVEPGNKWFATGAGDRVIKIWDLASGELKLSLTGHISTVRGLAVSGRHPYLFSAAEDKMVKCWDLESNKVIRHYHGHLSGVYALSLHPTLDVIVTAGRDATARVWDMRTKAQAMLLAGHTATIADVKCQDADPQVITGSMDTTVRLWDLAAGKTMVQLTHHKKSVRTLAIHPQEYSFATGSAGGNNIKKWKCPEGAFVHNFSGHNAIINTLSVNEDGVLFSGGDNGTLTLWDYGTGVPFQNMDDIPQPGSLEAEAGVFCSTFDLSGSRLITGGADKTIKVYSETTK